MKFGILNSGGDCPGLSSSFFSLTKALRQSMPNCSVYGISDGFYGLMDGKHREITDDDCSFIRTSRIGCHAVSDADIDRMKENYDALGLNCIIIFGGDDTARTALRLQKAGINILFAPKTIDNNVDGSDVTLGFYSAVQNASAAIQNVRNTAMSHSKIMIAEIEGESGWLTLYSGVAGGADIILLPEIPYSYVNIVKTIEKRQNSGYNYSLIVISDSAMTQDEYRMSSDERAEKRKADGESYISLHLAKVIKDITGTDAMAVIPSYILRGGEACSSDKLLSKRFATRLASAARSGEYGQAVVCVNDEIDMVSLESMTKKARNVPPDDQILKTAISLGISLGI